MTDRIDTAQERAKLVDYCRHLSQHIPYRTYKFAGSYVSLTDMLLELADALDAERARAEKAEAERDQALARLAALAEAQP